jgi:hypothetical protein
MEHDVFISHAHKDKPIADAICEKLESARVKCWIAARDISAGEDWEKSHMLSILGASSSRSGWPTRFRGATFLSISAMFLGSMPLVHLQNRIWSQPESGQMQPPNPGQNAKPAPLTQALDSSVQPARP